MTRKNWTLLAASLLFFGCGEPKTMTLDRMHTVGGSGKYSVVGQVIDVGNGILTYKEGETAWTNLRLQDTTGEYTFHFLPSQHERQPKVGDQVKILGRGKRVAQTVGGSPTVQLIDKFEYQN